MTKIYGFDDLECGGIIEIDEREYCGIIPHAEDDKVYLVNSDCMVYAVSKEALRQTGLEELEVPEFIRKHVAEFDEEILLDMFRYSILNLEELTELLFLVEDREVSA